MKVINLILLFCLVLINIHSEEKKAGYQILWSRPVNKDQVYFISQNLKVKYHASTQLNKSEIDKKTIYRDLYYDAKVTVVESNDKKIATCEKHDILSCYELIDGKKVELVEKGKAVLVRKEEKGKEILIDNKVPEKNLLITLNQIIELNAGGPTYNETMGECKNIMPGAEWKVLDKNILESYKAAGISLLPNAIKGTCKFEKVENNRLYFSGMFTIDPFRGNGAKDRKMLSNKYIYQIFEITPIDIDKLPYKVTKVTKQEYEEVDNGKADTQYSTVIDKEHTIKYFETEKEMSQ